MNWRELRFAPQPGTRLANLNELPESGVREAIFGEGKEAFRVLLAKRGQGVKAYLNRCPHFGIPLNTEPNKFVLMPQQQVMCAIHCAVFRIDDGHCVDGPVKGDSLTEIAVVVDEASEIVIAQKP